MFVLTTEFFGTSSFVPDMCLTHLTLVLSLLSTQQSCEDRASTGVPISEMRPLRLREVKPCAKMAQPQVPQLLACFRSWPHCVTLCQWLSLSESQFLYYWGDHLLTS